MSTTKRTRHPTKPADVRPTLEERIERLEQALAQERRWRLFEEQQEKQRPQVALDALGAMRADTAARFEKIEGLFLELGEALEHGFKTVDGRITAVVNRAEAMDARLEAIDGRLEEVAIETNNHGLALGRLEKMASTTLESVNTLAAHVLGARREGD